MPLFKKDKPEKVGLDLQNPVNQRAAIQASLNNKVPLISREGNLYLVDTKHAKAENVQKFFEEFARTSVNCKQGLIDRDDPKFDYILIYDLVKED